MCWIFQLTQTNFDQLRDLKSLTEQMMSLLSHEKQLITSLKKFAARIDDWLKADEKLPAVEAVSNDKTVAGDDDKKRRNSDSDDDDVFKPPQRKRTLFKNVSGVFDVESDDASSQPDFFSSTQKDDADFTVETTSSSSGSGKLREKEFLSPLPPPTRKAVCSPASSVTARPCVSRASPTCTSCRC